MPGTIGHPDAAAADAISARLASIQGLRLPASLLREQPYPEGTAVKAHLTDLLQRDASVFLERYGLLLSADELSSFETLRDNYEVAFYLQQAQAAVQQQQQQPSQQQPSQAQHHQQQQPHASSTVKNRRLAFMRRLEQQGEYFSEHSMRERQPLVWQECIGRYEGNPVLSAGAPAGERGFAGSLLASYDEAMIRARLQQQLEEEEAAMSEHDSDDSDTDLPAGQQQQEKEQEQEQEGEEESGQPARQQQQQAAAAPPSAALPPTAISTPAAASAGRTEAAQAARASAVERAAQQQPQPQGRRQGPDAGAVDMGPDALARRRQEFLLEMQHRFLDGLDGEHQDYGVIDADTTLDDDWAKQQAQDAEDAYFDAE